MVKAKCGKFKSTSPAKVRMHEVRCAACAKKYAGLTP